SMLFNRVKGFILLYESCKFLHPWKIANTLNPISVNSPIVKFSISFFIDYPPHKFYIHDKQYLILRLKKLVILVSLDHSSNKCGCSYILPITLDVTCILCGIGSVPSRVCLTDLIVSSNHLIQKLGSL